MKGNIMKKTIIALSIIPALALATGNSVDEIMQSNIEFLKQKGLPTPGSGVQVVPTELVKIDNWQREQYLAQKNQMKSQGYINENSNRAHEIIHIKQEIASLAFRQKGLFKPTDSHLRKSKEEIAFAYSYVGVPSDDVIEYYGIAPVGTYVKEPQSGWTGGVEFFRSNFANCAFTENNILASHGAANISEEYAQYDVNGKVTVIDVQGTNSTGYLYRVNWFDNNFIRNLECAINDYSEQVTRDTIELAKRIDRTQSA